MNLFLVPKGVIITRDNLDHNLSIISRSLQTSPNTVCVSWLPQYHDVREFIDTHFIFLTFFFLYIY